MNLAERVHRVRRRREYLVHSDHPQPGGIGECMYRLKDAGYDAQKVLELLAGVTIYPVFTAHPTESTRRTMLRKHQQIADMMLERLDPTLTPFERRSVWERIRMEVTSGWQTESHPRERLTVADEREHALFYLAEVVYRVVPALYEEIALWMQTVFGLPPELGRMPLILRFGSWVGGDMDGNNEVHAKAIRETLHRQQQRVISAYFQECRALADKLSQSAGRVARAPSSRRASPNTTSWCRRPARPPRRAMTACRIASSSRRSQTGCASLTRAGRTTTSRRTSSCATSSSSPRACGPTMAAMQGCSRSNACSAAR